MSTRQWQDVERIQRHLAQINKVLSYASCTCRGEGRKTVGTFYHTPEELECILYVPCPVHGFRSPGPIFSVPEDRPLEKPDWSYCTCPPDAYRDYQMGRRGKPTDEELVLEEKIKYREWKAEFDRCILYPTPESKEELLERSARVRQIIDTFWQKYDESRALHV